MESYKDNSRKQKSLLKKYGKHIKKAIVGGIIAVIGAIVIPSIGLGDIIVKSLPFLTKLVPASYDAAASISVWASIITTAVGTIKGAVNGIKAHSVKEELKNAIDTEEELFDTLNLELEKQEEKNRGYEEEISKLKEKNSKKSTRKSKVNENIVQNEIKEENLLFFDEDKQKIKK